MAGGTIKGSGTSTFPYLIEDKDDLLNINSVDTTDAYIELTQDIDMGGVTLQNSYLISFDQAPFSLDGRGHSISNYSILFDTLDEPAGTISDSNVPTNIINLGLNIDSLVSNFENAGVMFGYFRSSIIIKNCYTTSNYISGTKYVGGFVGYLRSSIYDEIVENCYSISDQISGVESVGGFAGFSYSFPMNNLYSYTNSISGSEYVGGLVGWSNYIDTTNCFAFTHKIIRTSSSTNSRFGGFTGYSRSSTHNYCYSNYDIEFLQG